MPPQAAGQFTGLSGVRHVDVDHAAAVLRENHENEQDLEEHRGDGEEVDGDESPHVVGEARAPGL
jgi:hypothetical protein